MTGICLIAGLVVYFNIMKPLANRSTATPISLNQPRPATVPKDVSRIAKVHEEKAIQWIQNPNRDPFAPLTSASPIPHKPSLRTPPANFIRQSQVNGRFILKAIAVEGQQRSAVINRTVVYEGEMIEGYQVMSIQPKGVWLKHEGRTQLLTFPEKPAA